MKISRRQLRRIIREYYLPPRLPRPHTPETARVAGLGQGTTNGSRSTPAEQKRNPHGWSEFIEAAEASDYDAAGQWIAGLAGDYGIQLSREEEDELIELASYGGTAQELGQAWKSLLAQKGK